MAVNTRIANRRGVVPVGTIIPFYDFGAAGPGGVPLPFDTKTWKYCDGTNVVDADSPLNGLTTPDLSGRYLLGLGTDGGGNIGSTAWATAAVGNTGHTIDFRHVHTVNQHRHTIGHTHSLVSGDGSTVNIVSSGSHTNHIGYVGRMSTTSGTTEEASTNYRIRDDSSPYWVNRVAGSRHIAVDSGANDEGQHGHMIGSTYGGSITGGAHTHAASDFRGSTAGSSNNNSGYLALTTNNPTGSWSAVDIRPRSIRVRFLLKIA